MDGSYFLGKGPDSKCWSISRLTGLFHPPFFLILVTGMALLVTSCGGDRQW
jgi:hypothetical protein